MRTIRQRTFSESIVGQFRRFVFDRTTVVENVKQRLGELRAELGRVDAIVLETLQKHGLDPAKALPRLDQMTPYRPIVAELRDLITQRNISTSLTSVIEDYETFLLVATDARCKLIGFGGMSFTKDSDTVDLGADEAKFLLHPFDAKAFAKALEPEGGPVPMGIGTAIGARSAYAPAPQPPELSVASLGSDLMGDAGW